MAMDAPSVMWGDQAEEDDALAQAGLGIAAISLTAKDASGMVGSGEAAAASAAAPASDPSAASAAGGKAPVDTGFGRDRAEKLDPSAGDASRNEIWVQGPVDYSTKTTEILGNGRTVLDARWEDLLPGTVGEPLRSGITEICKWGTPAPVQRAAIAAARLRAGMGGMLTPHIIAQAENGAGKTGAFCLASIIRCGKSVGKPTVLIIVPKQELAMQAVETLDKLTAKFPAEKRPKAVAVLPSGRGKPGAAAVAVAAVADEVTPSVPGAGDGHAAMNTADIVATSRGKLDSIQKSGRGGPLDVSELRCIVMDEVDELLEESSVRTTLQAILKKVSRKPMLLGFSATFDPISLKETSIQFKFLSSLLGGAPKAFLSASPASAAPAGAAATGTAPPTPVVAGEFGAMPAEHWLSTRAPAFITVRALTMPTITHLVWQVPMAPGKSAEAAKLDALTSIMGETGLSQTKTLVFCNKTTTVDSTVAALGRVSCMAHAIQGGLDTSARRSILNDFKRGTTHPTLVSTNMLAKGVDIEALRVVVHLDLPVGRSSVGGTAAAGPKRKVFGGKGRKGKGGGEAAGGAGGGDLDQVYFVHRSGRVGRGGRHGVVLSLVSSAEEAASLRSLFAGAEYKYLALSFERILAALAKAGITNTGAAARAIVRVLHAKPQGADGEAFVHDVPGVGLLLSSKAEAGSRAATVGEIERAVCDTIRNDA